MTLAAASFDIPIHGICAPEYAAVRDAFAENFTRRGEVGATVCVYKDGTPVVDLWGGYKDLARTDPWCEGTIVIMNSLAKSMCALCMHILIDRGKVDFDSPVADNWPEFGQAGKQNVLIRHILSHVRRDLLRPRDTRLVVSMGRAHQSVGATRAGLGAGQPWRL